MKTNFRTIGSAAALCSLCCGCGSTLPLIFADKTSVGINVAASEQGVEIDVGYKTKSIAIVPIAVRAKDKQAGTTDIVQIQADDGPKKDAYSTFGNFTVSTEAKANSPSASIGLGRFFATGVAAQKIAEKLGEAAVAKANK